MYLRAGKRKCQEVSLDDIISTDGEGNGITYGDIVSNPEEDIVDRVNTQLDIKKIYEAIDGSLEDREKDIILSRYGLRGNDEKTQIEISKEHGISRSYVSRIEKTVIEKLRSMLGEKSH